MSNDQRLECSACKKPIERGDEYYPVRTPEGLEPVHAECLRKTRTVKKPSPLQVVPEGDES